MFNIISLEVVQYSVFSEALCYIVSVVLINVDVALPDNSARRKRDNGWN